jgi:hypothetical protein
MAVVHIRPLHVTTSTALGDDARVIRAFHGHASISI